MSAAGALAAAVSTCILRTVDAQPPTCQVIVPEALKEEIEELVRLGILAETLKHGRRTLELLVRGRKMAEATNRERRATHHKAMVDQAHIIKGDHPYLTLDDLVQAVRAWCPTAGITFIGHKQKVCKQYRASTIRAALVAGGFRP